MIRAATSSKSMIFPLSNPPFPMMPYFWLESLVLLSDFLIFHRLLINFFPIFSESSLDKK